LDTQRLRQGEIVAGIGGLALFIFLFLDWFGLGDAGVSGWDSLGGDVTGFIVALTAISGIVLGVLAAAGSRLNIPVPRGGITAALGWLTVGIILWRILATPEGADIKFGLFLGLAAAIAIAVGATLVLREDGYEPLVTLPGTTSSEARTEPVASKTSAASAPATTSSPATRKPAAKKTAARKTTAKKRAAKKRAAGSS
jgi:hypothetical protein